MRSSKTALLLLSLLIAAGQVYARERKVGDLRIEPYLFEAYNKQKVEAELGHLTVPENRSDPKSRLIELAFVRFKSIAKKHGIPTIYLVGGPGASAIVTARGYRFPLFMALREVGDVLVLDQRGTGMSQPLHCREPLGYPLDKPLEKGELLRRYREQSRACAEFYRKQGFDLRGYNTNENADDVEALRRAIGARKIRLWGTSYGTHLSLAVIKRHGKSIHHVILAGVEGPDHTYKLPSNIQKNLQQIAELYRADPQVSKVIPDFFGLVRSLLNQLEKAPVAAEVTDPQTKLRVTVTVGKLDLLFLIAGMPGRLEIIKQFPSIAYRMTRGDFSKLAELSLALRRDSMSSAMAYMMDCASGASPERLARIRTEEKTTLVSRLNDFPFPEVCDVWGSTDLGASFRAPLQSSIPTLLISGTLDGRTPVSNAEEIRRGFPNSAHLIIEGAGHVDERFFSIRTQQVMLEFLKGERVSTTKITLLPLEFNPITSEEGK